MKVLSFHCTVFQWKPLSLLSFEITSCTWLISREFKPGLNGGLWVRVLSGHPPASCPRWLLSQSCPNMGLILKYLISPIFGWVCSWDCGCSERLQAQSKITLGIPEQQEKFGNCCQHMTTNLTCQMLLFKWLLANRLLREPKGCWLCREGRWLLHHKLTISFCWKQFSATD